MGQPAPSMPPLMQQQMQAQQGQNVDYSTLTSA
jgi:hypothetical protein